MQKIEVLNSGGEFIGETFPRRAKQLVAKGRAEWAEVHRIILVEVDFMSKDLAGYAPNEREAVGAVTEYAIPLPAEGAEESDDMLRYMAGRIVDLKRMLTWNVLAMLPASVVVLALVVLVQDILVALFLIGAMAAWGGYVLGRLVDLLKLGGLGSKRRSIQTELEFQRLKNARGKM